MKMFLTYLLICLSCLSFLKSNQYSSKSFPKGVYIHIPFCRRRCFYCDFPIKVIGERLNTRITESDAYTSQLCREILLSTQSLTKISKEDLALETIYFGGGTPSLLTDECINLILATLRNVFSFGKNIEITLEMDPGTFDVQRLQRLKQLGITRISMGVQSFNEKLLKSCGRAHSLDDVYSAINALNNSDFDNYSIDLISSLPGMTMDDWKSTLKSAVSTGCSHLSIYDLQIEQNTAFGRWYSPGIFPLPSEEISTKMYEDAVCVLTSNGFEHYEVSNYAKPNKRSLHNQKYWKCESYWGFGLGAASFLSGLRYTRPKTMQSYIGWVDQIERSGFMKSLIDSFCLEESETLTYDKSLSDMELILNPIKQVDILDDVMLTLRTSDGLNLERITKFYGPSVTDKIMKSMISFKNEGYVEEILSEDSNLWLRLSDPKGFLISNEVISSIFAELS